MITGTTFYRCLVGITIAVLWATVSAAMFGADSVNQLRPDLTGIVQDTNGMPISNAMVFIYTAAPKQGPSTFCPSCYADCRKRALTDTHGKFTIASLDPDLLFRVLVADGGWQPKFTSKVDPALKPLTVILKPQQGGLMPDEKLQGRVVDSSGTPVANAVINIRGVTRDESTQFGGNNDVDPVAVSDADGNFLITSSKPFDAAGVDVEARGFAKGIFQELATGGTIHTLKLTEGATITGRIVKGGKPLAGVVIDVSGANRESSVYIGDFSIATDANGKFLLANLPPRAGYVLCATMDSLGTNGCVPAKNVSAGDDGSTTDVGDIEVKPAFVVTGQIRLTDGAPLPAHQHVQLSRENPWDSRQIETDKNGHFNFVGVPPELVGISARVPGHRFSSRNVSLDPINPFQLIGLVTTNIDGLILEFEPGKDAQDLSRDWELDQSIRQEPLRGAETVGANAPGDIKVTGTVVDADMQKPVPSFTVIEGRKNSYNDAVNWLLTRQSVQSNGVFTVYLKLHSQEPPAVCIEADGYISQVSGLITTGETNFTFALKKGSGPAGVILQPNGRPATNATVYLADANQNGVYIGEGNKLVVRENLYQGTRKTKTDAKGRFSFPALPDSFAVIVVEPEGFAEVRVADLEKNPKVKLQKYARVEGRLMIGSHPGTNEIVDLNLAYIPYADYPRNFPPINLYLETHTDSNGKFVFETVPPIAVELYHQPKVRDSRMGTIAQSQTTALVPRPGKTAQVTLGGKGRPVIGRLVVTGYDGNIDYRAVIQTMQTIVPQPPNLPDMTAIFKEFSAKVHSLDSDEARKAAEVDFQKQQKVIAEKTCAFYQTDAGRRYSFSQHRYALNFSQDGTFRIEDVPGGKYNLQINLHESGGDQPFNQPLIGSITREITVPDSPGGQSDQPFDLGALQMTARKSLKVGTLAPDFEVKTLGGKPLKLSDYKGKFLLLDFWATWCGPCVAETPNLKDAWEAFKNNSQFAMVSLSLDSDTNAPLKFAAKNSIGWTQGFLGEWSKSDVPERFGVEGIPAIFLIGPDGKIVARDLRGPAIKTTLQTALPQN